MSKSIFASRTFWANALTLIVGITALVAGSESIAEYPEVVAGFISVQGILNIALRFLTTKPIR